MPAAAEGSRNWSGTEINLAVFDLNKLVIGMREELRGLLREEPFNIS